MKLLFLLGLYLLTAASSAPAATKCPFIDVALLNKGLPDGAPWRVMSGGQGECSFTAKDASVSFGFSHMVSESTEKATDAAKSMKEAVAPMSRLEPLPVLGEYGIDYNMKNNSGLPDEKSMFFYGHSGRVRSTLLFTTRAATIASGAVPDSLQRSSAASAWN